MLIRTDSFPVDNSYIPPAGQEVYDTIKGYSYIGNGYNTIAQMNPTRSNPRNSKEIICWYPLNDDVSQYTLNNDMQIPGKLMADTVNTECTFVADIPPTWRAVTVDLLVHNISAGVGNVRFFTDLQVMDLGAYQNESIIQSTVSHAMPGLANKYGWYQRAFNQNLYFSLVEVTCLTMRVQRTGGHASDTFAADVGVLACRFRDATP